MKRALASVLLAALSACGDPEVTQVIVTIDADPEVRAVARELFVEVYGGARGTGSIPRENREESTLYFVGEDPATWPVDIALAPLDEDATRQFRIVVTARRGTQFIGQVKAISGYVRGKTLSLRLYIDRFCLYHEECTAFEDQTCAGGLCVDARVPPDTLPEQGADAGTVTVCESAADCDDDVGCTTDECIAARCRSTPDDGACTDGPDGTCDPTNGCQYSTCDGTTCQPGPCQTAACVGGVCQRTSTCGATEMCCAGACVPDRCSDGNPCTSDSCVDTGCVHTPRDMQSCEDETYCNGVETCALDECMDGTPRCVDEGLTCDEAGARCVGCATATDCAPDVTSGPCMPTVPSDPCNTAGQRIETTTYFRCEDGGCVFDRTTMAPSSCTLTTDGRSCTNGLYCDGVEVCGGGTCLPGTPPCPAGRTCIESSDTCSLLDGGTDAGDGCVFGTEICTNGADDDCDGLADCDDSSCASHPSCVGDGGTGDGCFPIPEDCSNSFDDDCDGLEDCDDDDCTDDFACVDDGGTGDGCFPFPEDCSNSFDDDCDGLVDCDDGSCALNPACGDGGSVTTPDGGA